MLMIENQNQGSTAKLLQSSRLAQARVWMLCMSFIFFVLVIGLLINVEQSAKACKRSPPPPVMCEKSATILKTGNTVPAPGIGGLAAPIFVTITTDSGTTPPSPPNVCPSPATVPAGTITLRLVDPGNGMIINTSSFPLNPRPSGFVRTSDILAVFLPFGTPKKQYIVEGEAEIIWSVDSANPSVMQTVMGDTVVCVVDEAPGQPGIPRIDMQLTVPSLPECGAGVQRATGVTVTNNDPTESVTLAFTVTSTQQGRMPVSPNGENDGSYSFAAPIIGDDFPIAFAEDLPPNGVIPLPADSGNYTQCPLSKQGIVIPAGGSTTVTIISNSYPTCADGSCAEFTFTADGQFSGGDPIVACIGGTLNVIEGTPCPDAQFPNACCFGNGSCQLLMPSDCDNQGGTPLGAYSQCLGDIDPPIGDDACDGSGTPQLPRACCFEDGTCQALTPGDCANSGGTPQLSGDTCGDPPCPAMGGCCQSDGTCQNLLEAVCASTGGTYKGDGNLCDAPSCCLCPGDMNGDNVIDGLDILGFVDASINGPSATTCADLNGDQQLTSDDQALFIEMLLDGAAPCDAVVELQAAGAPGGGDLYCIYEVKTVDANPGTNCPGNWSPDLPNSQQCIKCTGNITCPGAVGGWVRYVFVDSICSGWMKRTGPNLCDDCPPGHQKDAEFAP